MIVQEGESMAAMAILSALLGAVIGFFAAGFGAANVLVSALGNREGGSSMGGLFVFGPIGGLAGALLGVGLVLRFGGGSPAWSKGLMIAAGVLTAFGGVLLAMTASPDRGPSYSYVIEFQLELPAATLAGVDIPSTNAMWGAGGADADDKPISQFFDKKCEGDTCVIGGSVAALGAMNNFRITTAIGPKKSRYPLDLPPVVSGPADRSEWRDVDGARARWRIVKR
jgi:MFS family permease